MSKDDVEFIGEAPLDSEMKYVKTSTGDLVELDGDEYPLVVLLRRDGFILHFEDHDLDPRVTVKVLTDLAEFLLSRAGFLLDGREPGLHATRSDPEIASAERLEYDIAEFEELLVHTSLGELPLSNEHYSLVALFDRQGEANIATPRGVPRRVQVQVFREVADRIEAVANEKGDDPL